jgi:hypothetical protein
VFLLEVQVFLTPSRLKAHDGRASSPFNGQA